jgi:XTP/dITP diphosphohydrolase
VILDPATPVHLATANAGKLRELAELLGLGGRLQPPPEGYRPPEEDGRTYRENALIKARALAGEIGSPAIADDSGLEIDVLGGAPGLRSARFAATDRERIARVLDELRGVPAERRTARFRCVLALVFPDGRELVAEGACEGRIAEAPSGEGGFGYDPIFLVDPPGRSFAELSAAEKDAVSHRGRAARDLRRMLENLRTAGLQ